MSSPTSRYLIEERPLTVQPTLIKVFGVEQAIILQQFHWLLGQPRTGLEHDGQKWIWGTYEQWCEDYFPFWSPRTLRYHISKLQKSGVIITKALRKTDWDHTNYYTIDYTKFDLSMRQHVDASIGQPVDASIGQPVDASYIGTESSTESSTEKTDTEKTTTTILVTSTDDGADGGGGGFDQSPSEPVADNQPVDTPLSKMDNASPPPDDDTALQLRSRKAKLLAMRSLIEEITPTLPDQWLDLRRFLEASTPTVLYNVCTWLWVWRLLQEAQRRGGLYDPELYERQETIKATYGNTFAGVTCLPKVIRVRALKEPARLDYADEEAMKAELLQRSEELLQRGMP